LTNPYKGYSFRIFIRLTQVPSSHMHYCTLFSAAFFVSGIIQAQEAGQHLSSRDENYSVMLPQPGYSIEAGEKYNDPQYYNHPDFGLLTFDAPAGKSVVEDLSKRSAYERFYVDVNEPSFFYIEKSTKPINYYQNGYLRAIDPSLKLASAGVYRASAQPCPTELNTVLKCSRIDLGGQIFGFNNVMLRVVHHDHSVQLFSPNWSQITVGNNGAYISQVFPGVDMKILYREGAVKSEFIIRQNLQVNKLVFIDQLQTGGQLALQAEVPATTDPEKGHILVFDQPGGQLVAKIKPARSADYSGIRRAWYNPYTLIGNNLEILCDSAMLNDASTVYPVVVDPLVTAVGPIVNGTTFLSGTLPSPAFCSNSIAVTYPGGTTPWDVSVGWTIYSNWCYQSGFDCYRSEAQIWITSSCGGRSPAGALIWTCTGCNSYGTWNPTLPFSSNGTQSLAQCYAASCAAQTQTYTINANRSYCPTYTGGYDACTPVNRSYCQTLDNWRVTVQGRSMETLGNTATGNGSSNVSAVCFAGATLNPSVSYGIGTLSYNWNPGGQTTSTNTVPTNFTGTQTYTCTVTDACGTVRTAVFNVSTNCVLPVELLNFDGRVTAKQVELQWQTASESNSSHFTIERSYNGVDYEFVSMLKAAGHSVEKQSYHAADDKADLSRLIYYRLKQYDNGISAERFSSVLSVEPEKRGHFDLFPNPGNGVFELVPGGDYTGKAYQAYVYDATGKEVLQQQGNGRATLDISAFPEGIYLVRILAGNDILNWRLMKQ